MANPRDFTTIPRLDGEADKDYSDRRSRKLRETLAFVTDVRDACLKELRDLTGGATGQTRVRKLSISEANTIRERNAAGETQAALAREYNVSEPVISKIVHFKTYV